MADIILLDGGTGQEIVRRSTRRPDPLWSARALLEKPGLVEAVHRDFIEAGATVITLDSYSLTPERLARDGAATWFDDLQARAIDCARRARAATGRDVRIAGCLPPLFGSYHPEATPPPDECAAQYAVIAAAQADAVDLFLCETMSSIREARAAVAAATATGRETWCSFTLDDTAESARLRSGEPLDEALAAIAGLGHTATLANCSRPETITRAMPVLRDAAATFGAYANGFTSVTALELGGTVDNLAARTDLGPEAYARHALAWVERGARIVGGCCEVGPGHIAHLHAALIAAGHTVTDRLA